MPSGVTRKCRWLGSVAIITCKTCQVLPACEGGYCCHTSDYVAATATRVQAEIWQTATELKPKTCGLMLIGDDPDLPDGVAVTIMYQEQGKTEQHKQDLRSP